MLEHILKVTCDMCGKSQSMQPYELDFYGWTPEHCPKCKRLRGKKPKNLTYEELRRSIMTFADEVGKRRI